VSDVLRADPRARALALVAALVLVVLPSSALASGSPSAAPLPPVRHVWVIMLENESSDSTFGDPAADPYLASTLPSEGALLTKYYAIGHASNDNYIGIVSGQPPNLENQLDCPLFDDFLGAGTIGDGIETGIGCVYPSSIQNIGTQLTAVGRTWKDYDQDMGNLPSREAAVCGHPPVDGVDNTETAVSGDGYATRHNPFVYFHSVIDDPAYCDAHVVALGSPDGEMPAGALPGETGLATDLRHASSTPTFSWITPNLCEDGHDYPCINEPSGPSALADIDGFLEAWVPLITHSPAYRQGGLLEITFDEAEDDDASACCGEPPSPAALFAPGIFGPGGGRIGAVLLSPYIAPGTVSDVPYNHYSSLASWEDLFGLPRLANAAFVPAVFGSDVFTAWPRRRLG